MKKILYKFLKPALPVALIISLSSCMSYFSAYAPGHMSVTPSVELEKQRSENAKITAKLSSTLDWNF